MKRFFTLLVVAAIAFTACDKKDEPSHSGGFTSISGTIQDMPTDAEKYVLKAVMEGEDDDFVIASCDVAANGSFSLSLPETVNSNYLLSFDEIDESEISGLTVSNPNVKLGPVFFALYADDEEDPVDHVIYASFSYTFPSIQATTAFLVYSDSACTVTGSGEIDMDMDEPVNASVNATVIKGWNWGVMNMAGTQESLLTVSITSKLPGGLNWFLEEELGDFLGR